MGGDEGEMGVEGRARAAAITWGAAGAAAGAEAGDGEGKAAAWMEGARRAARVEGAGVEYDGVAGV